MDHRQHEGRLVPDLSLSTAVATRSAVARLLLVSATAVPAAADDGGNAGISDFLPRHFPTLFDDGDGMFDLSETLDHAYGFFPLVTPITEPAVGAGAAFVPIFIDLPKERKGRPTIWAAGAMATNNGSAGYFLGYSGYFQEDRWHVFGGAADVSINLDFNGLGSLNTPSGNPLRYNLDMTGGLIGADRRIGDSNWRVGLRYLYGEVSPSLNPAPVLPPAFVNRFGPFDFSSTMSSVQAALTYDSRDNVFTPTRGIFSELDLTANLEALGASSNFQRVDWTGIWYRPLVEDRLFLGVKSDLALSFGDVPIYLRPAVELRGVPARSVQGSGLFSTEAELRWQFSPRWSVLGFAGAGIAWSDDRILKGTRGSAAGGLGFRYLIARRHGLHTGIDVAYGEDGPALYIQFGSGWFRP